MQKIYLSLIIPCYNEQENLKRKVLGEIYKYLKGKSFSWEVIISDDGSTDESRAIIEKEISSYPGFRLLANPHGGKPSALSYGIKSAKGDYILFTDMDQSTPIGELEKLLPHIKGGYAAIIGSRGLGRENFPLYRRAGAVVFSTIRRALILPEIADTQCGFKLFASDVLKKAFPRLEFFRTKQKAVGWKVTSFDVELLHIIKKMGQKIKEVTVLWNDRDISRGKGGGLSRYFRESKEMFSQIVRVKLNEMKGFYG
ncbi:hypothetical protein A2V61_04330 [Candidatus Woesebacteria bacterium RBG_19FT_COMBO_47_8]|uniref:Glycosyltransferase 2-like domain-containing protein n=1 Tax=Candidatus Woesebacteria bacterium RBG_13_46_13 TaxID=1802479 RepID=A0A1F7X2W4_9BACT|nr:MAG: hypothetical protein A2Y68_00415 [Candidatus Woesebacteria bacterium RBG_13_46_13]OGM16452.1 MAG: hypothetical protein A2V61_04330 [Candidatus Woesebacteria bacterium RBG_19FT_COMBO_47_8]HJX59032.1 glycosyltransferase [Patescibacteria group bacterium]